MQRVFGKGDYCKKMKDFIVNVKLSDPIILFGQQ